jgi:hypothetical protein
VDLRSLLTRLEQCTVTRLEPSDLAALLGRARLIRLVDTRLAGDLRILELDGTLLLQEQTTKGELLVRRLESLEQAEALVEDRLATYDRMWDGCGCKVDYYGQ